MPDVITVAVEISDGRVVQVYADHPRVVVILVDHDEGTDEDPNPPSVGELFVESLDKLDEPYLTQAKDLARDSDVNEEVR